MNTQNFGTSSNNTYILADYLPFSDNLATAHDTKTIQARQLFYEYCYRDCQCLNVDGVCR
jgi:hypothetical protein